MSDKGKKQIATIVEKEIWPILSVCSRVLRHGVKALNLEGSKILSFCTDARRLTKVEDLLHEAGFSTCDYIL